MPRKRRIPNQSEPLDPDFVNEVAKMGGSPEYIRALGGQGREPQDLAMAARDVTEIKSRLQILATSLVSVLVDLAFLVGWLFITNFLSKVVGGLKQVEGSSDIALSIVEFVSSGSMLAVILAYVVRDIAASVKRIWRQ